MGATYENRVFVRDRGHTVAMNVGIEGLGVQYSVAVAPL
jgi:hypothetical protein